MECREVEKLMPLYVRDEGEITEEEKKEIKEHLKICNPCWLKEGHERHLQRWGLKEGRRTPLPEPPELAERIRENVPMIIRERKRKRIIRERKMIRMTLRIVFFIILGIIAAFIFIGWWIR